MRLFIVRDGEEIPALHLGSQPAYIGRGHDSHLVVADPTVSSRHAAVWIEAGRAWLRDASSLNGTFVGDERLRGPVEIHDGTRIRLGANTRLVARGRPPEAVKSATWWLEHVEAGVFYPFALGRVFVGPGEDADVPVDATADEEVVVTVHPDGEIWRSSVDFEGPLAPGEVFVVGGRTFRVTRDMGGATHTRESGAPRSFGYRLDATLDGVTGAEASVEDPETGARHVIEAENRAVLLYVLAKRVVEARASGEDEGAWCADDDVLTAVWGKRGAGDGNSLHVLVHRLRKELKEAGFDPWFIEKRRKAIRLALRDVQLR
jgi:hypothetical protein